MKQYATMLHFYSLTNSADTASQPVLFKVATNWGVYSHYLSLFLNVTDMFSLSSQQGGLV